MSIYLDYNATTPLRPEVILAMREAFDWLGNPSSVHGYGRKTRRCIELAREQVAHSVGADPIDVVFTSGATEANNAVMRHAPAERILVSAVEHPSVLDSLQGKNAAFVPVTHEGVIDLEALESLLSATPLTTLVSVMWVNNETGVVQPITDIAALARRYGALFHCDAVQAAGKCPIDMQLDGIDYLTLSAHKLGGPAGIGALVYSHHKPLQPYSFGGGQERRRRAGTENMVGIAGFGAAAMAASPLELARAARWHEALEREMIRAIPGTLIAGHGATRIGNTSQAILPGVPAETQLMALDLAGFAVSSGSACSSGSIKPSHVLLAMGYPEDLARCAIRVSSGYATTENDLKAFLSQWVTNAQRFSR